MPKKTKLALKDRPLRAFVSRGVLTIEIGIDTLAFAALRSDYAYALVGGATLDTDDPAERFRIDDKREFARDVVYALRDEAEDGSSLLTKVLDDAAQKAIEDGSIAFIDTKEPD